MASPDKMISRFLKYTILIFSVGIALLIFHMSISYFQPDFNQGFLYDKIDIWDAFYKYALFAHVVSTPLLVILSSILIGIGFPSKQPKTHRQLGKTSAILVYSLFIPSSLVMSFYSFGGWKGICAFLLLTILTGLFFSKALQEIKKQEIIAHQRWMTRFFILLLSGIHLRLLMFLFQSTLTFDNYWIFSFVSWFPFLISYELVFKRIKKA